MLIHIDKLKRTPRQIDVAEEAIRFPVLAELMVTERVIFNESIKGSLQAAWVGDFIRVTGNLETLVTSPCCRCLAPVSTRLDVPILLTYVNNEEAESSLDEEQELQADDLGLIRFSGPELVLQSDLEQEIVMALPQQPLCRQSCRGLCPACGCDLNQTSCSCEPPILHPGLAALKNFKV